MRGPIHALLFGFTLLLGSCLSDKGSDTPDESSLIPTGLAARYDTLNGLVHLSWKKGPADVQGYLLFRSSGSDGIPKPVNEDLPIKDTFFVDTLDGKVAIREEFDVTYRLKSQDQWANASGFSNPVAVRIAPPFYVRTFITWEFPGTFKDTVSVGDTAVVRLRFKNETRGNTLLRAGAAGSDSALARREISGREGSVDIRLACDTIGPMRFWLEVRNADGTKWPDTLRIFTLEDPPIADAGKDTVVDFGTDFRFLGAAKDKFGHIKSREWDFDGAGSRYSYVRIGGTDTSVSLELADAHPYFRVTDDDGNAAIDSFHLAVRPRKPLLTSSASGDEGTSFTFRIESERDADLDRYLLVRSDTGIADSISGSVDTLTAKDTSAFRVRGLLPSSSYRFRLFALDRGGLTSAGEEIQVRTGAGLAWQSYDSLPTGVSGVGGLFSHLHARTIGSRIFVFGGGSRNVCAYNPLLKKWEVKSPMISKQTGEPIGNRESVVADSRLYVMGGYPDGALGARSTNGLSWAYDPGLDKWSDLNPMPFGRLNYALVAKERLIYCIGGDTLDGNANGGRGLFFPTGSVLIYDIQTGAWSQGPSLPMPARPNAAMVVDGKIVCLAGGRRLELEAGAQAWDDKGGIPDVGVAQHVDSGGTAYFFGPDSLTRYNARSSSWTTRAFKGTRRQTYAVAEFEGKVFLFGGDLASSPAKYFKEVDFYIPSLDGL